MKLDATASYFACPECGKGMALRNGDAGQPERLACLGCGSSYPRVGGIPRFVSSGNYAKSFGYQWNIHRRTQLDSHTGLAISSDRLFGVSGWPRDLRGSLVLEAGSGAGRFTEILVRAGATVFSFDYSTAVEANFANNGEVETLCLFQGDIFRIPLREAAFDRVLCLGVLQHTPDPEAAFRSLVRHLRPGGTIAIDVYARRLSALLSWKYLLRPVTRRMNQQRLYRLVERLVNLLLPVAIPLRRVGGRTGARLLPIVEYSHLGLAFELNREWAILDTFDMYSPDHDHPQSLATVRRWFLEAGLTDVVVERGPNGVIGRGRRPLG